MKRKTFTQKIKLLLLVAIGMLAGQQLFATDIVIYSLAGSSAATGGMAINYPGMGRTFTTYGGSGGNTLTSQGYSIASGESAYKWNTANLTTDKGWRTNSFSTAGYISIAVTFQMKASDTGPRNFKAQYSLNGTTWTDVPDDPNYSDDNPNIVLTNSYGTTYKFRLPSTCEDLSSVYVRLVQSSIVSVSAGTIGSATSDNASIKSVTIQAEAFAAPTSQSTGITIVSVTPTTITVSCTPGSGNRRLLKINTTNSFTDPTNDVTYSANSTYGGSGEQTVFVGSGTNTKVVITVPSSTNHYWLKYYDYNVLNLLSRYCLLDASANGNPKLCALESIHTPTSSNIRLINVSLGATIVTPTTGTVVERGVFWSTSPTVNENSNISAQSSSSGGVYSNPVIGGVNRGTTIYFRGYVTNESGTILTNTTASFSNVPIFNGNGTWEDNTKWNVLEVPGLNGDASFGDITDSPYINGDCTLGVTNTVTNLTVNSGKSLTISPAVTMNVIGTLANNAGTSGLVIKSSSSLANGSLIFASGNPSASVEMYSKANWNLSNAVNNKYKWQFFGLPVKTITAGSTFNFGNSYVREWDESSVGFFDAWVLGGASQSLYKTAGSTLDQNHGYELVQQNPTTYTFAGELLNTDYTQSLSKTTGAAFAGQHIFGNPYTAAIDIANIQFGASTEQAVYMYNTGTFVDWNGANSYDPLTPNNGAYTPGNGPGQYTVSTPGTAGSGSVPSQIPTAGSFLIKAITNGGSFTISKSTGLVNNADQMRVKSFNSTGTDKVNMRIDLIGQKFNDRMWIFTFPSCTRNFDNGFDGKKMLGASQVAQIYSMENDGIYQINAVSDMNESYLGFQPGDDTQFKLIFNHENVNSVYGGVYLVDLVANKTIDITQSGTEYAFTSNVGDATKRFKIITQSTGNVAPKATNGSLVKIYNSDEAVFVQNMSDNNAEYTLYNVSGRAMQRVTVNANEIKTINTKDLAPGVYVAKADNGIEKVNQRIIIR